MIARRGVPLRWRIAVLCGLAIGLLGIISSVAAYVVVRSSLLGDLQQALRQDAETVAQIYRGEAEVSPPEGPTGGVIIQIYDRQARLLAASHEAFQNLPLPQGVVRAALDEPQDWQGQLLGRGMSAALTAEGPSVIAVLSPTGFISAALSQLARALALTATTLTLLGVVIGYLVAASATRPVSELAGHAARLDPSHLEPVQYRGPNDEVGQLSRVLNDLIERLKAAMDAQRSFLAETSHELRTPLTSLQGFLDRAHRRADNPEIQRELEDARRVAYTMSRLVADILQLSRGQLVRELVPHLLDPYIDILKPVAEEFPGVCLAGEPGALLLGDPERLRQLLRNLTANAVRAARDPHAVTLSLNELEGEIIFTVQDSGPGIPPDILPHIFDKFYKGAGGGAGLGLAIAKQIADMHQGRIEVHSEVDVGTTFRVVLPAFADEIVEDEEPVAEEVEA